MKKIKIITVLIAFTMITMLSACDRDAIQPQPAATPAEESLVNSDSLTSGIFPYEFSVKDFYGNTVTERTLGEKQLFFVHLWATWCGPCIVEMPDLAALPEAFGDKVAFLGLISDYDSNLDGVKNIIENYGIPDSFYMVDANDPSLKELLSIVQSGYFPTTAIFSGDGKLVGELIIGAAGPGYARTFEELLKE